MGSFGSSLQVFSASYPRSYAPHYYCSRAGAAKSLASSRHFTAVNEALAEDHAGALYVAPAWPATWSVSDTVYVEVLGSRTVGDR